MGSKYATTKTFVRPLSKIKHRPLTNGLITWLIICSLPKFVTYSMAANSVLSSRFTGAILCIGARVSLDLNDLMEDPSIESSVRCTSQEICHTF